jgi:hypothetical protein
MGLMGIAVILTSIFTYDHYLSREYPELISKWNNLGLFTYITNIVVDFWLILMAVSIFFKLGNMKRFLSKAAVQTFLTVMIFTVGFLYCFVVFWVDFVYSRSLWWGNFITFWNHVIMPAFMVFLFFHPTDIIKLEKKSSLLWLVYPAVYLVFTMIRGRKINWYPYVFLNLDWKMFADLKIKPWIGVSLSIVFYLFFILLVSQFAIKIYNKIVSKKTQYI